MMEASLSHVALLVPSAERSADFLNSHSITTNEPEIFESEGTKEIYVGSYADQRGLLLLLEAISEGPYERAMTKRGPSLHHIAIDVLDVDKFLPKAEKAGWLLHPTTEETMAHRTAWLYLEGIPTLIEVHEKKALSTKPAKVSRLSLPIEKTQLGLFEAIGLGAHVTAAKGALRFTIDGKDLSFAQIACLN